MPAIGLGLAVAFLTFTIGFAVGTRRAEDRAAAYDVGFLQDMIAHHEQAVSISLMTLANTDDPTIRAFAQEVVLFQRHDLGTMTTLLNRWEAPQSQGDTAMEWMGTPVPPDEMPGLATDEQLERLTEARGPAADALFLAIMSAHHVGGVHMAEAAAENASDPYVRQLAQGMATNQSAEVGEYSATRRRLRLPVPEGFTDPPTVALPSAHTTDHPAP